MPHGVNQSGHIAARALARRLPGDERKNAEAVAEAFLAILQRLAAAEAKIQTLAEQMSATALADSLAESDSDQDRSNN